MVAVGRRGVPIRIPHLRSAVYAYPGLARTHPGCALFVGVTFHIESFCPVSLPLLLLLRLAKAKRERLRQAQLAPDYVPLGGASALMASSAADRRRGAAEAEGGFVREGGQVEGEGNMLVWCCTTAAAAAAAADRRRGVEAERGPWGLYREQSLKASSDPLWVHMRLFVCSQRPAPAPLPLCPSHRRRQ
jgi:hypothetical protein